MSEFDESELEAELARLGEAEEITEEDLESLRQSLPTDPPTARLVQKALWYPWSELFEFVEGSDRQQAYWRTKPDRAGFRSDADQRHKEKFARAARESTGLRGTVERGGEEIPASADHVAEAVEAAEPSGTEDSTFASTALARLRSILNRHRETE